MKFSLTGGEQALQAAFEIAAKHPDWPVDAPTEDRVAALDAAKQHRKALEGAEILWVDDRPSNNRNEARMMRSFGCLVTFAATTDEAIGALSLGQEQAQPFHLILSDISRQWPTRDQTAGLTMLTEMRARGVTQPIIFYIGDPKPGAATPPGAFGITHRPDELLKLTVLAIARVRGG
jgi:CheY-like chemotaxis protein